MKNTKIITDIDSGRFHLRFKKPYELEYDFIISDPIEFIVRDGIFGYMKSNISVDDLVLIFKYQVTRMWDEDVENDKDERVKNTLTELLEPVQILKEEYSPEEFIDLLGFDEQSKESTKAVLKQLNESFKQFGYHMVLRIGDE